LLDQITHIADDCGARARLCEGLTERIAIWLGSGETVYPFSASVGSSVKDGAEVDRRVLCTAHTLQLHKGRSTANCCALAESDLDAYDLIVAVDSNCRDKTLRLLKSSITDDEFAYYEARVRLLSDFIGYTDIQLLETDLQSLVAPYVQDLLQQPDVPRGYLSKSIEYSRMIAAFVLGTAGLVKFVQDSFNSALALESEDSRYWQ
jgi:protein-tyrosine-phosphatase